MVFMIMVVMAVVMIAVVMMMVVIMVAVLVVNVARFAMGGIEEFRLHLGDGRLLEIDADFDAASLGRLLSVLEQRCCP